MVVVLHVSALLCLWASGALPSPWILSFENEGILPGSWSRDMIYMMVLCV
jgi:hypothetical protein